MDQQNPANNQPDKVSGRVQACCQGFPEVANQSSSCVIAMATAPTRDPKWGQNLNECFSNNMIQLDCCKIFDRGGTVPICSTLLSNQVGSRAEVSKAPAMPQPGSPNCVGKVWEYLQFIGTAQQNTPDKVLDYCNKKNPDQQSGPQLPTAQVTQIRNGNPTTPPEFTNTKDCLKWLRESVPNGEQFDLQQASIYCMNTITQFRANRKFDKGASNWRSHVRGGMALNYQINGEMLWGGGLGIGTCNYYSEDHQDNLCVSALWQMGGQNLAMLSGDAYHLWNFGPHLGLGVGASFSGGGNPLRGDEKVQVGDVGRKLFAADLLGKLRVKFNGQVRQSFGMDFDFLLGYRRTGITKVETAAVLDPKVRELDIVLTPPVKTEYTNEGFGVGGRILLTYDW